MAIDAYDKIFLKCLFSFTHRAPTILGFIDVQAVCNSKIIDG